MISHNSFDAVRRRGREPLKAITVNQRRLTESESFARHIYQRGPIAVLLIA